MADSEEEVRRRRATRRYWVLVAVAAVLAGLMGAGAATPARAGVRASDPAAWTSPGYWVATGTGAVVSQGGAGSYGSLAGVRLSRPIVGMAPTPDGRGYWLVASDGGVFAFGDAAFHGSTGAERLRSPIVGMASTPDGRGYWLVAGDGGIFCFGDAAFHGSGASTHLSAPVVAMAAAPSGLGYWMATAAGQVLAFGQTAGYGSLGAGVSNRIVALAATPSGHGYWLAGAGGGIYSFGDAPGHGSLGRLAAPVVGLAPTPDAGGYLLAGADGGVFNLGDAVFRGAAGQGGVVAIAAAPPHPTPVVAAFYYPWYASQAYDGEWRHWNQGGHDPPGDIGSDFYPQRGAYSSSDPAVVGAQMAEMAQAGINEVIVSWWGEGSFEDERLALVEQEAAAHGLAVAVHIEPYAGRSATSVGQDITYLHDSYATTDFYVYRAQDFTAAQWAPVLGAQSGVRVWAESFWDWLQAGRVQSFAATAGFSGVYTYDPYDLSGTDFASICGSARMDHLLCSPSVAPGFSAVRATGGTSVRSRQNGATYDQMWQGALESDADVVSITSFNEWHEGSQIEPATPLCLSSGFCYQDYQGAYGLSGAASDDAYLDRTADWTAAYRAWNAGAAGAAARPRVAPTASWTVATAAGGLADPVAEAVDGAGNLYVADAGTGTVTEVEASGAVRTVAGTGRPGFSGDGGPAVEAQLSDPRALAVDGQGDVFIADSGNDRVREVTAATGTITTVAGGGGFGSTADGSPALGAALEAVSGLAVDAQGDLYFSETSANRVRAVPAGTGVLTTVAGDGAFGNGGDGGRAVAGQLAAPTALALDGTGDLYVLEPGGFEVREVSTSGTLTTVAGDGQVGDGGDNGPATAASLGRPSGLAVDGAGDLFISEANGERVREVDAATGVIYALAGTGTAGGGGGGPALSLALHDPEGLALDPTGNLYVADTANHVVRRFQPPAPGGCVTTLPAGSVTALAASAGSGYLLGAADGAVATEGGLACAGSELGLAQDGPVVAAAARPDGGGYWLASARGGVSAFGNAAFHGSLAGTAPAQPVVGMAAPPGGGGYWLVSSDGGVFTFGDAPYLGSAADMKLNRPIAGMASTPDGRGYWLVAADGGIFTYGDAGYFGSTGAIHLAKPIVGLAATPDGGGYWLVAADGGIFTYGDAHFEGSTGAHAPPAAVVGMAPTPDGRGYRLADADGQIFAFGDAG